MCDAAKTSSNGEKVAQDRLGYQHQPLDNEHKRKTFEEMKVEAAAGLVGTQVNQTPRRLLKNLEQKTEDLIMVKEKEIYELREMLRALRMASALLG